MVISIPGILTSYNLFNSGSGKSPPTSVHFLVSQQPGCLHLPEDIFTSPFSSVAANILQFCARGNQPDHGEGRYNSFLSSRPASQVGVIIGRHASCHLNLFCVFFYLPMLRLMDSGLYSCQPSVGDLKSVTVHVIRSEHLVCFSS